MKVKSEIDSPNQYDLEIESNGQQIRLYFSYTTVIGFELNYRRYVCENHWGRTTAKHLAALEPDHKKRIPKDEFEKKLEQIQINLNW